MTRAHKVFDTLLLGLIAASTVQADAASPNWLMRGAGTPPGRSAHAMAYDARGRVVVYGGIAENQTSLVDTWRWDGNRWIQYAGAQLLWPPPQSYSAMAYDSVRGRAVLFGGRDGSGDTQATWEWDGSAWTERTPETSPPARSRHAMAYDSARGRVVLFGGIAGNWRSDTWEWDGNTWIERTPATSPPARYGHAMAYDSARGRVVLFGGWGNNFLSDTWEWDGTDWVQQTPATNPPARYHQGMAYDSARSRVVLFGGYDGTSGLSDTWEWDGSTWAQRTPTTSPPALYRHAIAYDNTRGRIVLFGGLGGGTRADTWEWDGSTWAQRIPATSPSGRFKPAMAYDQARARLVLFGGSGGGYLFDTWEWDGSIWTQRTPVTSPPARYGHAMVYDIARSRVVLFGGRDGTGVVLSDTWEWDGSTWVQRAPATSPPARYLHAMAYDSARGRALMFGGYGGAFLSDSWEWDGTTWVQQILGPSPSARYLHAMAYDSARDRVVLFGGYDGSVTYPYLADTWEWDGGTWLERIPTMSPAARAGHAMAYDAARARLVLFGGGDYGARSDTWEWDGSTWVQQTPTTVQHVRYEHAMTYDSARGRVVRFGGFGSGRLSDTWEYGLVSSCGDAQSVVAFTPGDMGSTSALDALGPPDLQSVALGIDGHVIVRMARAIADGPGTDLLIHETGPSGSYYAEDFRVEASEDGVSFAFVGGCRGDGCQLDLFEAGLTRASYLRITDPVPGWPPGVDIDAASAMSCVGAVELCNGLDDGASGTVPPEEIDHDGDGFVACCPWAGSGPVIEGGGDCDDTQVAVHPGALETCNGVDDDCDTSIDEGVVLSASVPMLTEARSGTNAILSWSAISGATAYDVVKGNIYSLRQTQGDFVASTDACLASESATTSTQDTEAIAPGEARWHLVRAVACGTNASYDDGSPSQAASRDAGIAGSGSGCP